MHPMKTDPIPSGIKTISIRETLQAMLMIITDIRRPMNLTSGMAKKHPHKQTPPLATTLMNISPVEWLM